MGNLILEQIRCWFGRGNNQRGQKPCNSLSITPLCLLTSENNICFNWRTLKKYWFLGIQFL